jgi:hypothetical protein
VGLNLALASLIGAYHVQVSPVIFRLGQKVMSHAETMRRVIVAVVIVPIAVPAMAVSLVLIATIAVVNLVSIATIAVVSLASIATIVVVSPASIATIVAPVMAANPASIGTIAVPVMGIDRPIADENDPRAIGIIAAVGKTDPIPKLPKKK